jgi:hypothetical protein
MPELIDQMSIEGRRASPLSAEGSGRSPGEDRPRSSPIVSVASPGTAPEELLSILQLVGVRSDLVLDALSEISPAKV